MKLKVSEQLIRGRKKMDVTIIISTILSVIGGATILLNILAPLTKNKTDDTVLIFFKKVLKRVSLNMDDNKLVIDIKKE